MTRKETLAKLWGKFNFGLEFLPDRIRLQKIIYILCKIGYPGLGEYAKNYSFYVHGAYSPLLAKDAYELNEKPITVAAKFSDAEEERLAAFHKILNASKASGNRAEEYVDCELIGDMMYFCTSGHVLPSEDALLKRLVEKKAYFNDPEKVRAAMRILKETNAI